MTQQMEAEQTEVSRGQFLFDNCEPCRKYGLQVLHEKRTLNGDLVIAHHATQCHPEPVLEQEAELVTPTGTLDAPQIYAPSHEPRVTTAIVRSGENEFMSMLRPKFNADMILRDTKEQAYFRASLVTSANPATAQPLQKLRTLFALMMDYPDNWGDLRVKKALSSGGGTLFAPQTFWLRADCPRGVQMILHLEAESCVPSEASDTCRLRARITGTDHYLNGVGMDVGSKHPYIQEVVHIDVDPDDASCDVFFTGQMWQNPTSVKPKG